MESTQLLEELADAVALRNSCVAALRNASTHVTELTAQAIAAGAPGPDIARILTTLEPVVGQERQQLAQDAVVPQPRPEPTDCSSTPSAKVSTNCPAVVRQIVDAFAARGHPEWLTLAQIADHLVGVDPAAWGQWEGRRDRLNMVGRTIRSVLRRAGVEIPCSRLDGVIDRRRPTIYKLADVQRAAQDSPVTRRAG
ncbi:hypothetical protein [Streptomyces noursei]|uniref:hypothetical protein n=1 Tax=Streptomyces noursei TaxID=1971 RepID=UPI0019654361|nr:hypothetical protein [Streptomyces noursei]QRX89935.1 hypothetical protein JNO44_02830 [Streptomyces noursei]